jgi:hypothetical protein
MCGTGDQASRGLRRFASGARPRIRQANEAQAD